MMQSRQKALGDLQSLQNDKVCDAYMTLETLYYSFVVSLFTYPELLTTACLNLLSAWKVKWHTKPTWVTAEVHHRGMVTGITSLALGCFITCLGAFHGQFYFILQIVECRRVLKWTYAYGFYLPDHEHAKRQFFEYLQGLQFCFLKYHA
jgi:hypothetical protein